MAYEKIEPNADGIFYVYIIILCVSVFLTYKLYTKYSARKTTPAKLMLYVFIIMDIAILVLLIGFTQLVITREKREIYQISLALGFFLYMLVDMAVLKFGVEVFSFSRRFNIIMNVLCIITAILVVLPLNGYGLPNDEVDFLWFRPMSSGLLVLISMFISVKIARASYSNSKIVEDKIAKVGFRWIGHGYLSMFLYTFFLLMDTLYFIIMNTLGYSFFVYLAWIAAASFYIFSYMGLIMPDWLKKRYLE